MSMMSRYIKRIFFVSLLVLPVLACGGGNNDKAAEEPSKVKPTEIVIPSYGTVQAKSNQPILGQQTPTVSVPTATTTSITTAPPPSIPVTKVIDYGFKLTVDKDIKIESSGLEKEAADPTEGIMFFEYGGTNSIILWFEDKGVDLDSVLSDAYTGLNDSQSELTFSLISDGNISVDSIAGNYLTFVTKGKATDKQAGGIIGSWKCKTGTTFALTVTGPDPAVLQIRFKKILDEFKCE